MQKGFTLIFALVLTAVVIAALGGAYYFGKTYKPPLSPSPTPPQPTSTPQPSPTPSPDPTANWKTYINAKYGLSFRHPNFVECCSIAGPLSGSPKQVIVLARRHPEKRWSTDAPFDGLGIYVVRVNAREDYFRQYIQEEKQALLQSYRVFTGEEPGERGNETPIVIGGRSGVILKGYSWDGIERIYVSFPSNQRILVISKGQEFEGSFDQLFSQILSTFKFLE